MAEATEDMKMIYWKTKRKDLMINKLFLSTDIDNIKNWLLESIFTQLHYQLPDICGKFYSGQTVCSATEYRESRLTLKISILLSEKPVLNNICFHLEYIIANVFNGFMWIVQNSSEIEHG